MLLTAEEKEEHSGWMATLIYKKTQIIYCVCDFYFEGIGEQNLPGPTFHLLPAFLQNFEDSLLVFEVISSPQREGKQDLCRSYSDLRNGAYVRENRHEEEWKVGHILHHRTHRWMEPVPCAFTLPGRPGLHAFLRLSWAIFPKYFIACSQRDA